VPESAARPVVAIARCAAYDPAALDAALAAVLEPLGGMAAFVRPGQRVFLKPNLLSKAEPERQVTTHPEVLASVVRAAKACGAAEVMVGDSPGGPTTARSIRSFWDAAGWTRACETEGARLVFYNDDVARVPVPVKSLFASFNLGRESIEADVLISLPKLKTHGFMMFTGAVKNLFGLIPAMEKTQFHFKVPDRDAFGEMLVDLMLAAAPDLAIMDAVVGMEGEGPAGGTPKPVGALIASADSVALDVVASSIAGFDPLEIYTNKAAHRRGIGPRSADEIDVHGVAWRDLKPETFAKPDRDISRRMPKWVAPALRRVAVSRPYLERPRECTSCRTCEQNCPVQAIEMAERRPAFNYDRCIRCYCCQELCPPQVIGLKRPWLVRTLVARDRARKA
jgi:uncharacterized protein (DUF362 family)/Pyruvate/2-oxoacid:ferredoxin oxidoreductase delta subunit